MATQEEADRYRDLVLGDLSTPKDGIDESYVYTHERGHWERFMLAGNGPTVYAYFVFRAREAREPEEVDHAYVEYCDFDGSKLAAVPQGRVNDLLEALRASARAGIERHR